MARNEAKIKFNAEVKEFNDSIHQANNSMSELRAEMRLNETQMKATGDTAEGLKKKQEILEKQHKQSKDIVDAMTDKLKVAERTFGKNSDEASRLRTQLFNAQNAEQKLEQAVREANKQLDNQDDAAREAGESFTVMKGAMADLVADGIEAVAGGLAGVAKESFTMANDIDSATDTFIAKTGESTKYAGEFEDAMTDIYNGNYGESFEDISDAMATVKQTMGDIGTEELEDLTRKSLVLRDTFDFEVNESIRGANSMMDKFGITSEQAYNLIAQGAQNGLNQNGDLLDVVNEYSVQFSDAGFKADEMFNMLANGAESGTWSIDKLGDAMKEYNIRVSDGTVAEALEDNRKKLGLTEKDVKNLTAAYGKGGDAGKQAMQKTLKSVMSVKDETERYKLGVSMFGTMWEDLGEDAVVALFNTKGEISSTKDALGEINSVKYDNLGSALEGVKRNLQTSVAGPMKDEVMPAVNEFIEDVDWESTGQTIGKVFGALTEGALAIAGGMKDAVGWMKEHKGATIAIATAVGILAGAIGAYNIVQGIKAAMDAKNVGTVWALVAAHWAQAAAAMAAIAPYVLIVAAIAAVIAIIVLCVKNWDKIKKKTKEVWESIKNTVVKGAKAATNKLNEAKKKAVEIFENMKKSLSEKASKAKEKVVNTFKKVLDFFKKNWKGLLLLVVNPFAGAFKLAYDNCKGFRNKVNNFVSNVKKTFKNGFAYVKEKITTSIASAKNKALSTIESLRSGFSSKVQSVKKKASSVFSSIKTAIINPIQTAKEKVSKTVDGIKGLFDFSWSIPKPKIPKFTVSGGEAPWGIGGKGKMPSIGVKWNAAGGILTKPTIFGAFGGTLLGGGEAGHEAILPIKVLQDYINRAFDRNVYAYAAAGGTGDVYNLYVNDARINDNEQIRDVAKDFITDLVRLGGMNR